VLQQDRQSVLELKYELKQKLLLEMELSIEIGITVKEWNQN